MSKVINVRLEFFDFTKSNIKHLKENGIYYEGYYYAFEEKIKNFWQAKIRINAGLDIYKQIRAFIHEAIHCVLDYYSVFVIKDYDKLRVNIKRHHFFCYIVDNFVYWLFKIFFRKEIKSWRERKR